MLYSIICFYLFFFLVYLAFFERIITINRTAAEGGAYLLIFFLPILPTSQTLAGLLLQRAHLCSKLAAGIKHRTFGTCSLELSFSILARVTVVVGNLLKTLVTLGNISLFLSNLIKQLVFVMVKDSSFLSMFTKLTFIFSL